MNMNCFKTVVTFLNSSFSARPLLILYRIAINMKCEFALVIFKRESLWRGCTNFCIILFSKNSNTIYSLKFILASLFASDVPINRNWQVSALFEGICIGKNRQLSEVSASAKFCRFLLII